MKNFFNIQISLKTGFIILLVIFFIAIVVINLSNKSISREFSFIISRTIPEISIFQPSGELKDIKKFSSEEEYRAYLEESQAETEAGYFGGFGALEVTRGAMGPLAVPEAKEIPERVSETTVQVLGVDEPDIVKTDGKEIFFSRSYSWIMPLQQGVSFEEQMKIMPPYQQGGTHAIKAFPPADLKVESKIDKSGDLLLAKNILVIFSGQEIFGYDVSNPASPQKKWEVKLENNNYLIASRLYKNKVYLVTRNSISEPYPCIIKPLTINGSAFPIDCREIYHPVFPVPIDSTFIGMILDSDSGKVEKTVSFTGSSDSSVVYMSENALYITYSYYPSVIKFFSGFFKEKSRDLVPNWLIEKMDKLESYDISQAAKLLEFQMLWEKYLNSLSSDERLKAENEFNNRMTDYYKEHKRDLEKTGIVKVNLSGFEIVSSANVPGYPLNQFSLDEYEDHLRIATTIGGRGGFIGLIGGMSRGESANDVYVLDRNLKITGMVKDLGLTEKIYSVRFIEDKGYVVTFRETDPFYVLDLADPKKPELKGELKIPGYSSYLHPITKDKILGIGKENWQVKVSLFDVASPANPIGKDKYILDEGWSEVLSTHHAFLLDKKHEIFFLPGGKGGYIFSYKNDRLALIKAISEISAKRAIYINDYLYIIGENKITVINENDWQKVSELKLD